MLLVNSRSSFGHYGTYILILSCLLFPACKTKGSSDESSEIDSVDTSKKKPEKATPVEVKKVRRGPITSSINAVAVLSPKEKASVRSLVTGLIQDLLVEEGDVLKKGQKIAILSRPGSSSLIQQARVAYQKARRDVKRLKVLVKKGLVPEEELIQAKFVRDQNAIELRRLREEAKHETLRSPIAGVVVKRPVYQGESVSPGQLVVEVMDLSQIYAPLKLPDRWAMKVTEGMSARLLDRDGQTLTTSAEVTYVSPIIDAETGTFVVWVSPHYQKRTSTSRRSKTKQQNKHRSHHKKDIQAGLTAQQLKPGLFVNVEITLDHKDSALLVPRQAILYKDGRPMVSQVIDNRVRIRELTLGYTEKNLLEVLSPLREGDIVISFGQRGLEEGTLVKPIQKQGTSPRSPIEDKVDEPLEKLKR